MTIFHGLTNRKHWHEEGICNLVFHAGGAEAMWCTVEAIGSAESSGSILINGDETDGDDSVCVCAAACLNTSPASKSESSVTGILKVTGLLFLGAQIIRTPLARLALARLTSTTSVSTANLRNSFCFLMIRWSMPLIIRCPRIESIPRWTNTSTSLARTPASPLKDGCYRHLHSTQ